jgi:hypothetical protein
VSSYPVNRLKTDWPNKTMIVCRVFLPVRRSSKSATAISVSRIDDDRLVLDNTISR